MKIRINTLVLCIICFVFFFGYIYSSNVLPLAVKESSEKMIWIKNIDIFTGDPEQHALNNMDILIKDNRIAKIGYIPVPETSCKVISGKGKMVIPGLIDHHTHIRVPGSPPWFPVLPNQNLTDRNLSAFLYAGVCND